MKANKIINLFIYCLFNHTHKTPQVSKRKIHAKVEEYGIRKIY